MRPSWLNMMAFCPEHPKRDQNPKFTPLSETTSIRTPFICGVPPLGFPIEYYILDPNFMPSIPYMD